MNENMNKVLTAFDNFKTAAFDLLLSLENVQSDKPDLIFCEDYPFQLSFDELFNEIVLWTDTQKEIIKGAYEK